MIKNNPYKDLPYDYVKFYDLYVHEIRRLTHGNKEYHALALSNKYVDTHRCHNKIRIKFLEHCRKFTDKLLRQPNSTEFLTQLGIIAHNFVESVDFNVFLNTLYITNEFNLITNPFAFLMLFDLNNDMLDTYLGEAIALVLLNLIPNVDFYLLNVTAKYSGELNVPTSGRYHDYSLITSIGARYSIDVATFSDYIIGAIDSVLIESFLTAKTNSCDDELVDLINLKYQELLIV